MYDADVGIVFQSPGAFMIRALASKEDMMPSEVMMSRYLAGLCVFVCLSVCLYIYQNT